MKTQFFSKLLLASVLCLVAAEAQSQSVYLKNQFGDRNVKAIDGTVPNAQPAKGGYQIVSKQGGVQNQTFYTESVDTYFGDLTATYDYGNYTVQAQAQINNDYSGIQFYPDPDNEKYVWNSDANTSSQTRSKWMRGSGANPTTFQEPPGTITNSFYSFQAPSNGQTYTYRAQMKRECDYQRSNFYYDAGYVSNSALSHPDLIRIENNPVVYEALEQVSTPARFLCWGKNGLANDFSKDRYSEFLADKSRRLKFFHKSPDATKIADGTGSGSQRRIAIDASNGRMYQTYTTEFYDGVTTTSTVVARASTDGGATWLREQLVGIGKNPSIDAKDGWFAVAYLEDDNGTPKVRVKFGVSSSNYSGMFINYEPTGARTSRAMPNAKPVVVIKDISALVNASELLQESGEVEPVAGVEGAQAPVPLVYVAFDSYESATQQARLVIGQGGRFQLYSISETVVPNSAANDPNQTAYHNPSSVLLPNGKLATVWQSYYPALYNNDFNGIYYTEFDANTNTIALNNELARPYGAGTTGLSVVGYQNPTVTVEPSGYKHIAWSGYNHNNANYSIVYKPLPSWNDPTYTATEFSGTGDVYYSGVNTPIINWHDGYTALLYSKYNTVYSTTKPTAGNWSAWQTRTGIAPSIPAKGSRRFTFETGASNSSGSYYNVNFATISVGGYAELRGASGDGGKSNTSVSRTGDGTETLPIKESASLLVQGNNNAFARLHLKDVELWSGNTSEQLGAKLFADSQQVSADNFWKQLSSKTFTANGQTSVSGVIDLSDSALASVGAANLRVRAELMNGETLLMSSAWLTADTGTASQQLAFSFPLSAYSGQTLRVRVKAIDVTPIAGQHFSCINTVETVETSAQARGRNNDGKQTANSAQSGNSTRSIGSALPTEFGLSQNYPNPFNPQTVIEYALPEAAAVRLIVYDMLGRAVQEVVNETKTAGTHAATFDASRLTSGTYFYRIQAGNFTQTKKMLLVK